MYSDLVKEIDEHTAEGTDIRNTVEYKNFLYKFGHIIESWMLNEPVEKDMIESCSKSCVQMIKYKSKDLKLICCFLTLSIMSKNDLKTICDLLIDFSSCINSLWGICFPLLSEENSKEKRENILRTMDEQIALVLCCVLSWTGVYGTIVYASEIINPNIKSEKLSSQTIENAGEQFKNVTIVLDQFEKNITAKTDGTISGIFQKTKGVIHSILRRMGVEDYDGVTNDSGGEISVEKNALQSDKQTVDHILKLSQDLIKSGQHILLGKAIIYCVKNIFVDTLTYSKNLKNDSTLESIVDSILKAEDQKNSKDE